GDRGGRAAVSAEVERQQGVGVEGAVGRAVGVEARDRGGGAGGGAGDAGGDDFSVGLERDRAQVALDARVPDVTAGAERGVEGAGGGGLPLLQAFTGEQDPVGVRPEAAAIAAHWFPPSRKSVGKSRGGARPAFGAQYTPGRRARRR